MEWTLSVVSVVVDHYYYSYSYYWRVYTENEPDGEMVSFSHENDLKRTGSYEWFVVGPRVLEFPTGCWLFVEKKPKQEKAAMAMM